MKKKISIIMTFVLILSTILSINVFAASEKVSIEYQAHVSDVGWQNAVTSTSSSVKTAGTTGQAKRIEALKITLNDASGNSMIKYRTHVANVGWQNWKASGQIAGTTGKSLAIEAIQIVLNEPYASQYDVMYRMHVSNKGWLEWAKNGETAGSTGISLQAEAIQIKVVDKNGVSSSGGITELTKPSLTYRTHIQDIGWQSTVKEGQTAGTTGRGLRMEAITVSLKDFDGNNGISYNAHVSDIGWQGWKSSGETAGTTGKSLAIEAIQIKLSSSLSPYFDIYYRMHCANKGWLGWAKNGEIAGTTGGGVQAEAIEIKLVPIGTTVDRGGTAYIALTSSTTTNGTNSNRIINNISKVRLIKQGSKTCKATAVAQSVNIIMGKNAYSTASFGNASCKNINGKVYTGSDGKQYKATYKTDSYKGSASEQQEKINEAISNGIPIIVAVRKTTSGTNHHWVTIIGKSGNTYEIIDPATGTKRTMSSSNYALGMKNSGKSGLYYGYICFTKQ